ncbi:MAG: ComEC/Rec2 family competence protein, partial [Bacteroidota bacterium]|nr:ComEC/Rec2 family competence protein [Bacteroidota bacterium]
RIDNEPKETEKSMSIRISVEAYRHQENWYAGDGQALVYLQKDSLSKNLRPGMLISFKPKFNAIENAGNPNEFDYAKYMSYHMIASQTYLKSGTWKVIGESENMGFRMQFLKLRQKLLQIYQDVGLTGDEYAVAAALSLGYKDKLQDDIRHAYSSSGAMHVLAVSGLHVGIIFLVMQSLLGFMRRKKSLIPLQVLILVLSIWFYAALTGLSPSVTRAAIMFSFISVGKLFGRHVSIYNILAASAFVTLIINPLNAAALGFWLSYLAVLSIVLFFPPIYALIKPRYILFDKLWSLVVVSIAAQIGTAPLTIYFFNQFSNYFILTNILVIPIVTFIVYLAMSVFVFSFIPVVAAFLGKMLAWVVSLLNTSVFWIESLPASVSENLYISPLQMVILFLIIISAATAYFTAKRQLIWTVLSLFILFFGVGIFRDIKTQTNEVFVVYNLRGNTGVNCITGNEHVLFTDFETFNLESVEKQLGNYWLAEGVSKEKFVDLNRFGQQYMFTNLLRIDNRRVFLKSGFVGFADIRALILVDGFYANMRIDEPIHVNYLIYTGDAFLPPDKINSLFEYKLVILDASIPFYRREQLIEDLENANISYYDVAEQGAFIHNISGS